MCNKKHNSLLHANDGDAKQSTSVTTALMDNQAETSQTMLLTKARLKVRNSVGHLTTL